LLSQSTPTASVVEGLKTPQVCVLEWGRVNYHSWVGNRQNEAKNALQSRTLAVVGEPEIPQLAALLDCIKLRESSDGKNLYGDHYAGVPHAGVPRAFGA